MPGYDSCTYAAAAVSPHTVDPDDVAHLVSPDAVDRAAAPPVPPYTSGKCVIT